jgi:hypothetical protein
MKLAKENNLSCRDNEKKRVVIARLKDFAMEPTAQRRNEIEQNSAPGSIVIWQTEVNLRDDRIAVFATLDVLITNRDVFLVWYQEDPEIGPFRLKPDDLVRSSAPPRDFGGLDWEDVYREDYYGVLSGYFYDEDGKLRLKVLPSGKYYHKGGVKAMNAAIEASKKQPSGGGHSLLISASSDGGGDSVLWKSGAVKKKVKKEDAKPRRRAQTPYNAFIKERYPKMKARLEEAGSSVTRDDVMKALRGEWEMLSINPDAFEEFQILSDVDKKRLHEELTIRM